MQGIFIDGRRPKSKKEIREVVALDAARVTCEVTSLYPSTEYDGLVANMPIGRTITFVGPDPHVKRNFYGSITRTSRGITVK